MSVALTLPASATTSSAERLGGTRTRHAVLIGRVHVTIPAGKTRVLRIHLDRAARRQLGEHGKLTAILTITTAQGSTARRARFRTRHAHRSTHRPA